MLKDSKSSNFVVKEILKNFFQKHDGAWPATKYLERGFTLKVGPYSLKGKIDRVDERDGGLEIIDYKTGNVPKRASDMDKDQLLIYQLAVKNAWGVQGFIFTAI